MKMRQDNLYLNKKDAWIVSIDLPFVSLCCQTFFFLCLPLQFHRVFAYFPKCRIWNLNFVEQILLFENWMTTRKKGNDCFMMDMLAHSCDCTRRRPLILNLIFLPALFQELSSPQLIGSCNVSCLWSSLVPACFLGFDLSHWLVPAIFRTS